MRFEWPEGFARLIDDDWVHQPIETLALKYDTVENHGWYSNLEPTVADVLGHVRDGQVVIDYSGGTGILVDRLLQRAPDRRIGFVIVDASPKFLRLALEKFRGDDRVAFRLIRYLKSAKRLEFVDEIFDRRADALVSTNAIHLYYDLAETLRSWRRVLQPGSPVFVQSGNIRNPAALPGEWIIDETVHAIHAAAMPIVRSTPRYAPYREVLDAPSRLAAYDALRSKYFLPVRPVDFYLDALREAGFAIEGVTTATIEAHVAQWREFLSVYHEGVLGWVGGAEKIEGRPATEAAIADRLMLLDESMSSVFRGREAFPCCWTYIAARS